MRSSAAGPSTWSSRGPRTVDRLDPDRQRPDLLLARRQRLHLERQPMFAGLPVLLDLIVKRLAVLAAELPRQALLPVDLEDQPAPVVVEDVRRRIARSPSGPATNWYRPACSAWKTVETVAGS